MNFREGFARVARATAVVYFLLALVGVAVAFMIGVQNWVPPESGPMGYPVGHMTSDWRQWQMGARNASITGFWLGLIFIVLMLAFRCLRWIVRGFLA